MKRTISVLLMVVMAVAMMFNTGCASYMVYKESAKQVAVRKALITNNQAAIRSLQLGGEPQANGIGVTVMEAISERPGLQTGAAVVDGLVLWGGYEGVRAINGDSNDSSNNDKLDGPRANNNSSGENTTIVQGNGNTVTVNSGQPVDPNAEFVAQQP